MCNIFRCSCFSRHILGNLARVVGRDASRATAQVADLYVALCEDETIYGLFKTMKGSSSHVVKHSDGA